MAENDTNITLYGRTRDELNEAKALIQGAFPSYFDYDNAHPTDDYLQPDRRHALRLEFADASLAKQAAGVASQVYGVIKRDGFAVEHLPKIDNQIRLKL